MPSTSAEQDLSLPAVAMSLEQFRAFLGDVRNHYGDGDVKTRIRVHSVIETLHYSRIDELNAEDSALPDTIEAVDVAVFMGERLYDASHSVKLKLEHGELLSSNTASIAGPAKGWVVGLSQAITQGCRRYAIWYSFLRLRVVLFVAAVIMFAALLEMPHIMRRSAQHDIGPIIGVLALIVSTVAFYVFVSSAGYTMQFSDDGNKGQNRTTALPHEALMLLLAILSFVLALIMFRHG